MAPSTPRSLNPRSLRAAGSPIVALFAASVFGSAFLLFQVQPMVAKRILPWFGGTPGVWTVCLAFYQLTLFLGYAYAHLLVRWIAARWQPAVHALLFVLALSSLPVLPGLPWKPLGAEAPIGQILAMLAANVGLPFLFLSASGPLIQSWFAGAAPKRSPYGLYAVSNAGSFVALLAYPFLVEPLLPLSATSRFWSFGLLLVGPVVLCCGWLARQRPVPAAEGTRAIERLGWARPLLWFSLSASAVVLLMAVTNELCLDVASIPFLWVAPLALYLLTFVVCFSSDSALPRMGLVGLSALSLLALGATGASSLVSGTTGAADIRVVVGAYSLVLLFHCLMLHRELYALRPEPSRLTAYYLCISLGGAVGGLFVGIGAPLLFSDYYELPLGLVASWVLLSLCWLSGRAPAVRRRLGALAVAVGIGVAFLLAQPGQGREGHVIHQERSFFGILRVVEIDAEKPREHRRALKSGTTLHGLQFASGRKRQLPTLYYGEFTGIGFAMRAATTGPPARIGIVGLGVGTLAAYGRAEDTLRYYEIDPAVVRLARDPAYFTALESSRATIEIVEGDGRLALEADFDAPGREPFRLLALDAFSSDAIPVHLLTTEAFAVYARALPPDGVLAVHVSNANLDLAPLVFRLGETVGMKGFSIENRQPPRALQARATWVLLSRDTAALASLVQAVDARRSALSYERRDPWVELPREAALRSGPLFTDDYSDVFGLLKRP